MNDMSIYRNRKGVPDKLSILAGASALEETSKKLTVAARKIREYINTFTPEELTTTTNTRSSEITTNVMIIRQNLTGLEALYNKIAGEPTETNG